MAECLYLILDTLIIDSRMKDVVVSYDLRRLVTILQKYDREERVRDVLRYYAKVTEDYRLAGN